MGKKQIKLRSNITAGTVLILLAGRYRGCRVVFLKQLQSGLLLVTGPFGLNRCPIHRISQREVIATSTKIALKGVNADKVSDDYFKVDDVSADGQAKDVKKTKEKKGEKSIFSSEAPKKGMGENKKKFQKQLDTAVIGSCSDELKAY